jgi:WD40 repeat protein
VTVEVENLVTAIGRIDRRITIMVDALDEAASGEWDLIASRLIVPLGRLSRVRVLLGSRRSLDGAVIPEGEERHGRLRAVFGADAIIDDLEDEQETRNDIAAYVRLRLAASAKHRGNLAGIAAAADGVAARADGVFLYARIVSRTLQESNRLDGELPATALDAFAHDLQARFGPEQQRVDDILGALAWGEGKGLTRRVWPLVATALQQRPYDDDDVTWVLAQAGWHIVEGGEAGQAAYRLAHQALADHYRARLDATEAQGRIVAALTKGIERAAWLDCDRYVWRHLASHAAQAGRLDELIRDPGYLAVADPTRLVIVLPFIRDEGARRFADIYNRVADRLIQPRPIERLPLIHMMAQMEAPDLAPVLEPPVQVRWQCRWARVQRSAPHRIIGRHSRPNFRSSAVFSVALGMIEGHPVVLSASDDQTICLWDARTGELLWKSHTSERDLRAAAFGEVGGRAVVVSGAFWNIGLWDARTGDQINSFEIYGVVYPLVFGVVDGRAFVATAGHDNAVRLWNASTGEAIGKPLEGHRDRVYALASGTIDGRVVVISGSNDTTLRLWDVRTGEPIGKSFEGHTEAILGVAIGAVDGRPIVASGGEDRTIRIWDAHRCEPIGKPLQGHRDTIRAVALGTIDGRAVIVSGSTDRTIRLWDAGTGESIGEPLEGHEGMVRSVALATLDGHAVVISGSDDPTIPVWDVRKSGPSDGRPATHTDRVWTVALGKMNGREVVASGSFDRTIRLWDAHTGEPIGKPLEGHTAEVMSVALGTVDGRAVVVSGGGRSDNTVRLWDACTGEAIGKPLSGHTERVSAVVLASVGGREVVISGSWDGTLRLWDARTCQPIGKPFEGAEIRAVVFDTVRGRPVVISGAIDQVIRLWDARTGELIVKPFAGHRDSVDALAFGTIDGRAIVVSGSTHLDPAARVWDSRTGEQIALLEGHTKGISALKLGTFEDRDVILAAGYDGTIRVWDARTYMERLVIRLGIPIQSIDYRTNIGLVVGLTAGLLLIEMQ